MFANSWNKLFRLPVPHRMLRARYGRPRLEGLEDRLAPATLDVTGGALAYTAGAGVNNNLTVSLSAGTYTFSDSGETITLTANATAAGFSGSGSNTVTGPASAVTASLSLALGDGGDTLALGPFDATLPALTVTDGGQEGDTATVVAGGQGLVASGAVSLTGFAAINVNNGIDTSAANAPVTLAATAAGGSGLGVNALVNAGTSDISLSGDPILITAGIQNTGTLTLTDTGTTGVTELGNGSIGLFGPGPRLVLADTGNSGVFQLTGSGAGNSTNTVTSLTADVHNAVLFSQSFITAMTVEGINTNGHNVAVTSHGQLTLGDGSSTSENITATNAGVFLVADGVVQSSNCIITAYGLSLLGLGTYALDQPNQVFDLAANIGGSFGNIGRGILDYHSGQPMLTGSVGNVSGVTTNSTLSLRCDGLLALGDGTTNLGVVSAAGTVTLNAAGIFENTNAFIVSKGLELLGSVGDVLNRTANAVATLAANVQGPVTFTNMGVVQSGQFRPSMTVGGVGFTSGINLVGDLTINIPGGVLNLGDGTSTHQQDVNAADVFLNAFGITQASNSVIGDTALSLQGGNTGGIPASFALTGANLAHTLAANVQGVAVTYTNATGLIVGPVGSLNGINTNNNPLTLTVSNGVLALGDGTSTSQDVNTGTATAQLVANGGLFENGNGAILANALSLGGAVGCVADGPNAVGTLSGNFGAALSFADTQLLTVGVLSCPDVTLIADAMALTAPLRSNTVEVEPLTPSLGITLGGSVAGTLSLTDADLAALATTNFQITFGRPDGTGPITVAHPVTLQASVVLATTGAITGLADITVPFWATVTTTP